MNPRGKPVPVGLLLMSCFVIAAIGATVFSLVPRAPAQYVARVADVPLEQAVLVSCDAEQGQCFVAPPVDSDFGPALPYAGSQPPGETSYLWLARDAQGKLRAFVARHPDKACAVGFVQDKHRFEDPCYGAIFAMDGSYADGPATRGLDWYPADMRQGSIVIELKLTQGKPHE